MRQRRKWEKGDGGKWGHEESEVEKGIGERREEGGEGNRGEEGGRWR